MSYLIDFLPSYLFPNEERTISQFLCIGKSLGGHATWIVLRNGMHTVAVYTWILTDILIEPRIKIAVPIIGEHSTFDWGSPAADCFPSACPDYLALMSRRARSHKLPVGPPYFPAFLLALIARADPCTAPYTAPDASNPFHGKKILVLSGQDDKKVPWTSAQTFVDGLNVGAHGVKEVIV